MLRKTTALFTLLLFLALPASAQISGLGGIGVKGGVDFATLRADDDEGIGYQTDFLVGVYGQIPTASNFLTIQPEVLYARKGASVDTESDDVDAELNLDYIEIPVLLKANLPVQARFFPSLYAGPYVGFAVNKSFDVDGGDQSSSVDLDEEVKTIDYGVALGADFDVVLSGYAFNLGGRYDLGLANIDDSDDDVDISTGTFMITLGFAL